MGVFQNSYTVCGFEYVYNWIMQVGHWLINVPKSLYIQMSKNETYFYPFIEKNRGLPNL